MVSISACHAEDPGSIPSGGVLLAPPNPLADEVFSTIKDPFGLETKSCSKSSRPIVLNVEAGAGVN